MPTSLPRARTSRPRRRTVVLVTLLATVASLVPGAVARDCLPGPGCLQWVDLVGAGAGIGVVAALIGVRRAQRRKDARTAAARRTDRVPGQLEGEPPL